MLVDHIGAVFYMFTPAFFRWIGRLSMPLYVYLVAQGCAKTGDINRYMCRLGVFALLSEIPFDLAFWQGYYIEEGLPPAIDFLTNTNIFYALFFGVVCINVYENAKRNAGAYEIFVRSVLIRLKFRPCEENRHIVTFLFVLLFIVIFFAAIFCPVCPKLALVFVILSYILFSLFAWPRIFARFNDTCDAPPESERLAEDATPEIDAQSVEAVNWPALLPVLPLFTMGDALTADYGSFSVVLIFILYLAKSRKRQIIVLLCGVLAEYGAPLLRLGLSTHNVMLLLFALVSVAVVLLYNGKPGIRLKWAFYWFYPSHIALLAYIWLVYIRPALNGM
jgi:hypothetical protein